MPMRRTEIERGVREIEEVFSGGQDPNITVGRVPPPLGTQNKKTLAEMKVDYVPIDSVKLWAENPRKNDKAATQLADLISEHGVKSPLVVWRKDKTIYKGNTTYKALKLLGWVNVPVIFHDFPSKAAATAYGIADNKASEYAGWDKEILAGIMKSEALTAHAVDRDGMKRKTGFSEREITALMNPLESTALNDLITGKKPFVVIEFEDKEEYQTFKTKVGGERVLSFTKLNEGMGFYE